MYETFYGLRQKPFSLLPDPDFLYLGQRHGLALTLLEYGVDSQAGFSAISGEIGCGKTTLIRHLLNRLPADVSVGLVAGAHRATAGILEWVALALGVDAAGLSGLLRYDALQRHLIKEYAAGRRVLLIVDEAQALAADDLEVLRMLSNINADKDQMLQIILVGQPQLRDLLQLPELRQFAQRLAVHFHIPPLEPEEVANYIGHRLAVAGRTEPLFSAAAVARIAAAGQGIPRRINILCDTALVYGYGAEAAHIDADLVEDLLRDQAQYGVLG